ncbi:GIY-YIG nuclease family protein [Deinococcus koreensis]|uniref:GIY-YIG nuclease family protein n=1 Tax=Deinococcus koreensis TaxID=2054903 RepID=A0A2K3UV99_9DEIO|nr:GIY-YIG nuclease family protein [Deinococcus koreensis]PNY80463.1 hypothetical protein CVO96_02950 [Deinococcus koreensis]
MSRPARDPAPRMGVYRITHVPSGRTLLGWSVHLDAILNRTRFELQTGTCRHKALQADWQQSGPGTLTFEVLDELTPTTPEARPHDDLRELLTLWQETLNIPIQLRY